MNIARFITEEELKAVEEAVKKAEKHSSGEIVPAVAYDSDDYPEVPFRAGALLMVLTWLGLLIPVLMGVSLDFSLFSGRWGAPDGGSSLSSFLFFLTVSGGAFGGGILLTSFFPGIRRLFISQRRINEEVRQAALEMFLDSNCHLTSRHSGILIYISLFERRVEIIADKGINDALGEEKGIWDSLVKKLVSRIKEDQAGLGLKEAVESCGVLIAERFPSRLINKNELPNSVRIKE